MVRLPRLIPGPPGSPDAVALAETKASLGAAVTVCLPARNEETTIGHIVASVRRNLMERVPLVDEVVVIDDGSSDGTADVALWEGANVFATADVLPSVAPGSGKGNALWGSLHVTKGDIVCWIDADLTNFRTHFVKSLLEPLLMDSSVGFVKGYYRRPFFGQRTGGGRVTELMARPVISTLFPHLAGIVQPLAGEYAGRRSVLESVPFLEGWGVELGLLIDIAEQFGVDAIAQRDLGVREHRNRPIEELGTQAMAVLITALRHAGVPEERIAKVLVRYDEKHQEVLEPVEVRERPPIKTIPAYAERFGLEIT